MTHVSNNPMVFRKFRKFQKIKKIKISLEHNDFGYIKITVEQTKDDKRLLQQLSKIRKSTNETALNIPQ